jgi:hypothetical protein
MEIRSIASHVLEGLRDLEELDKGITLYTALYNNIKLGGDAKKIADEVIERFGELSLDELLQHVYSLDEVRGGDLGEEIL